MTNCTTATACDSACADLGGRYNSKTGKCWTFEVLKRLCAKVDLIYSEDYKTDALIYNGGCFKDDEAGYYVKADPDKLYKFEYIPVEVRSAYDPYTVWTGSGYDLGEDNKSWLQTSYVIVLVSIVFGVLTIVFYQKAKTYNDEEGRALNR